MTFDKWVLMLGVAGALVALGYLVDGDRTLCRVCYCSATLTSCRGRHLEGVTSTKDAMGRTLDLRGSTGFPWAAVSCQEVARWARLLVGDPKDPDCLAAQIARKQCEAQVPIFPKILPLFFSVTYLKEKCTLSF